MRALRLWCVLLLAAPAVCAGCIPPRETLGGETHLVLAPARGSPTDFTPPVDVEVDAPVSCQQQEPNNPTSYIAIVGHGTRGLVYFAHDNVECNRPEMLGSASCTEVSAVAFSAEVTRRLSEQFHIHSTRSENYGCANAEVLTSDSSSETEGERHIQPATRDQTALFGVAIRDWHDANVAVRAVADALREFDVGGRFAVWLWDERPFTTPTRERPQSASYGEYPEWAWWLSAGGGTLEHPGTSRAAFSLGAAAELSIQFARSRDNEQYGGAWEWRFGPWVAANSLMNGILGEGGVHVSFGQTQHAQWGTPSLRLGGGYGVADSVGAPHLTATLAYGTHFTPSRTRGDEGLGNTQVLRAFGTFRIDPRESHDWQLIFGLEFDPRVFFPPYSWQRVGGVNWARY